MGDHVCSGPPAATPSAEPSFNGARNTYTTSYRQDTADKSSSLKASRLPPPRVDTSGANTAFLRPDQLTPASASTDSRSISPRTPLEDRRSPFGKPLHRIINGPPSPEILSSNLDTAFPPFPTAKKTASRSHGVRNHGPGAPVERRHEQRYVEADPKYAPMSPGIAGTGHLLQRMNTIVPGPFDINGPRSPSRGQNVLRTNTAPDVKREETTKTGHSPNDSLTSSAHTRSSTTSSNGGRPMFAGLGQLRMERTGGYAGFGRPADQKEEPEPEPLSVANRASTFPLRAENRWQASTERRPSAPGDVSQARSLPNAEPAQIPPGGGRRPSDAAPGSSRAGSVPRMATPVSNLAEDFGVGNPYHTPNLSQSSNGSERSAVSQVSSHSSPPSDTGRGRRPSENPVIPLNIPSPTKLTTLPAMEYSKSVPLKPSPLIREQFAKPLSPNPDALLAPESPMDPSIQGGRLSPIPPRSEKRPGLNRSATLPTAPRPTTSKGNCRGCEEPIKGKSVSSADGRLTGRYHKQCFVCKTCKEPFATTTFYVIDDAPYCERHYHQLNNSICQTCDRGIEGQYLETERKSKHHPHCLTCGDCRKILRDGYFEMNGRVYCERDAFRRAQQKSFLGPGMTNRMEKRSTRLMNI
ncbi:MAG: hypothetical protein M1818_004127 [Claussenomyces sp. TS43310]|nr:MAG: hypothetical protein M1818_004127 [Claussenomyces sp. TS43310]